MTAQGAQKASRKKASDMFREAETFCSFSVDDLKRAKDFYGGTLGLDVSETKEGLELTLEGNSVFIYPKPNHTPASFTVLNFSVDDIEEAVADWTGWACLGSTMIYRT